MENSYQVKRGFNDSTSIKTLIIMAMLFFYTVAYGKDGLKGPYKEWPSRIIEAREKDGLIEAHRFFIVQFTRVCSCVETCMLCLDNITA